MEPSEKASSTEASPPVMSSRIYDDGDSALRFLAQEQEAGIVVDLDLGETQPLRWKIISVSCRS